MSKYLTEGEVLEGRYQILHQIGEGGMGVVYEAVHLHLQRKCAVKILHPSESDDKSMLDRFKIEAQSAANIRHPNIVEVMDFGLTSDRRPFFVMEFLVGESLADRLDREVKLSEREAVEIMDQVLSGLAVAHNHRIIHRDLKPDNLFINNSGDNKETVKILDFGTLKIVQGSSSRPPPPIAPSYKQLTQQGIILGTPGYMAPETLFGSVDVDARADLFAMGVILYEMIVGQRPFRGPDPQKVMLKTVTKPVPQPSRLCPDISKEMERLMLTALAKEPADRFQTAEEFLENLVAAAVGRTPADARPCKTKIGIPSIIPQIPAQGELDMDMAVADTGRIAGALPDRPSMMPVSYDGPVSSIPPPPKPSVPPPSYAGIPSSGTMSGGLFPSRRTGPLKPRRFSIPIGPFSLLFLLGLGGAGYYFFLHQRPMKVVSHLDDIDKQIVERINTQAETPSEKAMQPDKNEKQPTGPDGVPIADVITIWLDADPLNLVVNWNGTTLYERPLIVQGDVKPSQVVFSAPGYKEESRTIVPDREQTVTVRLKKIEVKKKKKRRRR